MTDGQTELAQSIDDDVKPRLAVGLSTDKKRIVLKGRCQPWVVEFLRSLPKAYFFKQHGTWSCDNTPMAIYRIWMTVCRDGMTNEFFDAAVSTANTVYGAPHMASRQEWQQPAKCGTKSKRHQVGGYWFCWNLPAAMLGMAMGTMKSKIVVDLAINWDCCKILILCPKSVLGVWRREFDVHAADPLHIDVLVLDKGTSKEKAKQAKKHLASPLLSRRVIVVNYETAKSTAFAEWSLKQDWDLVVCDESHRIKAHNSQQSKYAAAVGQRATRRLALTGTPMPHGPLDLFGQFRFLDSGLFGTSYVQFRHRYALMQNPHVPQQITGYRNGEELKNRMALLTYRVGAEVLDLPEVNHHSRSCEMCLAARKHYAELEREFITQLQDGVVTAANALVKSIRLRQAANGFLVQDDTKKEIRIDDAKQNLLAELLEDIGQIDFTRAFNEPVIVFCTFIHDLMRVRETTESLGRVYGEISGRQKDLTEHGTMPAGIDVMGVQIQSGGVGIDLTRACYSIYYSHPWSLGDYEQSLARVHRPGQTRPVHYYHLSAVGTMDAVVQAALAEKREVVDSIMEVFEKKWVKRQTT